MRKRKELQKILEKILGSSEVYFQPPAKIRMKYPAIVYYLDRIDTRNADNQHYSLYSRYAITIMTKDVDSTLPYDILTALPTSSYDRSARLDNLYHHYLTIYY